jgi:Xaa-Pro aminopeptidase
LPGDDGHIFVWNESFIARTSQNWRGIGIRIEDDVLVTNQCPEVLTAAVPKLIEDLEH